MALSKPLLSRFLPFPLRLPIRFLCLATPTDRSQAPMDATAERRLRKRRLRVEPPNSRGPTPQRVPGGPRPDSNPNAPKLPEPASVLSGKRLDLHRRILALVRENDLDEAALLTRHSIYSNYCPTVFTCNAVLAALLHQARYADLLSLHRFVTQASVAPTVATHNLLLQAYCDEAMDCYAEVLGEGSKVRFGAVSYSMVLDALGRNGRLDDALQLFDRMCREHDPPRRIAVNLGSFNVMVDAYCRAEKFQDAIEVFEKMGEKRCAPDALSYNSLIDWLGKNKLVGEAEGLYKEMGELGVNPDEYTYVLLIESCFKVGRVDDDVDYFNKMFDAGLRPNANAFNKFIGGLVKVDRLDEAQGLFDQMPEKEVKPNIASGIIIVLYIRLWVIKSTITCLLFVLGVNKKNL